MWEPISTDAALGLVYAPTGNATPDYWDGHRSAASNRYASSVVALDAATGRPRWAFQTTHYDLWDYDVASQPVLFDLTVRTGMVPALIQPTKRGELFILDRRTGKPIFPVEERPAPRAGAVETVAPTQPWSVALPHLGGPRLTESMMWGITAIDQLWCRISFRQARYEGSLTPPGLSPSIADPGYIGGVNWGSASIDSDRQLTFIASTRLVNHVQLIPRTDTRARGLKASSTASQGGFVAQEGTPYAADIAPFLSPLGIPCQQPPYGMLNAIDLATGRMAWSRPLGSARDLGPLGMRSRPPLTIGTPLLGGVMSTASGLVFVGASCDHALRVRQPDGQAPVRGRPARCRRNGADHLPFGPERPAVRRHSRCRRDRGDGECRPYDWLIFGRGWGEGEDTSRRTSLQDQLAFVAGADRTHATSEPVMTAGLPGQYP